MVWDKACLKEALDEAIQRLPPHEPPETAVSLRPIIRKNLSRGRVSHFLDNHSGCQPYDYVLLVARHYEQLAPFFHQVQVEKATSVWQPLYLRLFSLAYTYLLNKGFSPGSESYAFAEDCAVAASERLLKAYYPYDTSLEAWLCLLVQNVCRNLMKESRDAAGGPNHQLVDIYDYLGSIRDGAAEDRFHCANLRLDLQAAIGRLVPPACQEVVRLRHFEGLTFRQIAIRMGSSTTTVYKLHFAALEQLRKNLGRNGYK
ncbi:MAG: sigma-70 family RNA polymerase sigma factor [Chloroflexota bacterium]